MRVYISADIEGVAGVTSWDETYPGRDGYEEARDRMNREVAAACRGAIAAGADEIVVKDGHETALNLKPEAMPRGVKLLRGWGQSILGMMLGVDRGFDCAFFVGYHSEASSPLSPLSHTSEFDIYQEVYINGEKTAEMDINAMSAAMYNVPLALVTGDKGICLKASDKYPWVKTAAVKEGIGGATLSLHPDDACELIEKAAREAVEERKFKCAPIPEKLVLELVYKNHVKARSASLYPGAVAVDGCTVRYEAKSLEDMLRAYNFMS